MSHGPSSPSVGSGAVGSRPVQGFRTKLLVAMMFVVSAVTALAVYVADRNLAATIGRELQQDFQAKLTTLHSAQAVRYAALVERCRALVRKPRIHAALEDNALDLLYPSAEGELRDVMPAAGAEASSDGYGTLRARFYRFLDRNGRVIAPPPGAQIGALTSAQEGQLALPSLDRSQQLGYLPTGAGFTQVIATPIISSENGEVIAALVLGFTPLELTADHDIRSGIWAGGRLRLGGFDEPAMQRLVSDAAGMAAGEEEGGQRVEVAHTAYQLFFKRLNPGSHYPPAYEVSLYPLERFAARENALRLKILGLGALLLAGAFVASRVLAGRLSDPVEKLAADSERSARFSADASHQLKTPVTVLRAGLEELMTRDNLTPDECDAIAALIHQTYRLSSLIEDLLLLSRMDSGRLKLALRPVDLSLLIAAALDDLSAIPDDRALQIETDVPPDLHVRGEQRYTAIILHNLLENARKYNQPGGKIRVVARVENEIVVLTIGNTGRTIGRAAQAHIFERFHRGAVGEDVPGYGLGLNLARELARLHEGDLRLIRSENNWTEFELRFCVAQPQAVSA